MSLARYDSRTICGGSRKKRFIEGADRRQSTLFPDCVEDWIDVDNPVRVIDVLVDDLDLAELGFDGVDPELWKNTTSKASSRKPWLRAILKPRYSSGEEALTLFRGRMKNYKVRITDVGLKARLSG